jgi:hypothetical protein
MFSPNLRSLYTAALTPPPGMIFDEAIGTTFSLDPEVLLSVPVYLAFLGGSHNANPLKDGIAVLESVRRLSDRITVYAQRGRILAPNSHHVLYGLLEPMVVEVTAPRGGVFHPKLWIMRFTDPAETASPLLRLMVLSRNLTADRSWDVALTLEGHSSGRYRSENRTLGELIAGLPNMAFGEIGRSRTEQALRLADELRRTEWDLPPGFEEIEFHVFGVKRGAWKPDRAKRTVVISPFCSNAVLEMFVNEKGGPDALISRPETLDELMENARNRFKNCFVLDDAAETEDGEAVEGNGSHDTHGLHAKVFIFERGWNTHIFMGSANATNSALIGGRNVEVLAELIGKRSQIGGVDKLLGDEGLGEVLTVYQPRKDPNDDDLDRKAAEMAIEAGRDIIARADLRMKCSELSAIDGWRLALNGRIENLDGILTARTWPITVTDDRAVDMMPLQQADEVELGVFAPASITGLTAIELSARASDLKIRFVLNLPVEGLPEDRDAAVLQTVVRNRDGFLRYLLLLLGDLGYGQMPIEGNGLEKGGAWNFSGSGGMPILEELVRAYSREPERLREVARVVRRLTEGKDKDIVPTEFLETWKVFEKAMETRDEQ